jgi:hypothetical protein
VGTLAPQAVKGKGAGRGNVFCRAAGERGPVMRREESPGETEAVSPGARKKEARTHRGHISGRTPHRRSVGITREVLPIGSTSLMNGTQAAFLTLLAALGDFFNLSLAANSCLTLRAMGR